MKTTYRIEAIFTTGAKGVVCHHVDDRNEYRVYLDNQDTGRYVRAEFDTREDAYNVAADVRYLLDAKIIGVDVVEVTS